MNKQKLIIFFIILLFGVDLLVISFNIGGVFFEPLRNTLYAGGQLLSIIGGIYAVNKFGIKNKTGKTLLFFTLGLMLWLAGGAIFAITDFLKGVVTFPSIADGIIFIGYALILIALIHEVRSRQILLTRVHKLLLSLVVILTALIVFYLNVYVIFDPATPLLITAATVIYSFADIILVSALILVLILANGYSGGKLFYPWFYLFIGMVLTLFADVLFSIYIEDYLGKTGINVGIDVIWRLAYVFFAIGLFKLGFVIANIQKNILSHPESLKS